MREDTTYNMETYIHTDRCRRRLPAMLPMPLAPALPCVCVCVCARAQAYAAGETRQGRVKGAHGSKTSWIQDMLLGVRLLKLRVRACASSKEAQGKLKASSRQAQEGYALAAWSKHQVLAKGPGSFCAAAKGLAAFVQLPGLTQVAGAVSMCAAAAALALAVRSRRSSCASISCAALALASHAKGLSISASISCQRALALASHAKVPACRRASRLTSEVAQLRHSGGLG